MHIKNKNPHQNKASKVLWQKKPLSCKTKEKQLRVFATLRKFLDLKLV